MGSSCKLSATSLYADLRPYLGSQFTIFGNLEESEKEEIK